MDNPISALERMYQRTRTLGAQEDAHNDNDHMVVSIALSEIEKLKAQIAEKDQLIAEARELISETRHIVDAHYLRNSYFEKRLSFFEKTKDISQGGVK